MLRLFYARILNSSNPSQLLVKIFLHCQWIRKIKRVPSKTAPQLTLRIMLSHSVKSQKVNIRPPRTDTCPTVHRLWKSGLYLDRIKVAQ